MRFAEAFEVPRFVWDITRGAAAVRRVEHPAAAAAGAAVSQVDDAVATAAAGVPAAQTSPADTTPVFLVGGTRR